MCVTASDVWGRDAVTNDRHSVPIDQGSVKIKQIFRFYTEQKMSRCLASVGILTVVRFGSPVNFSAGS